MDLLLSVSIWGGRRIETRDRLKRDKRREEVIREINCPVYLLALLIGFLQQHSENPFRL